MSQSIALDPERMAPLEPSENEGPYTTWMISPFEVPKRLDLQCGTGFSDIRSIRFEYTGGETGEDWTPLDDRTDPDAVVRYARETRKILEMTFGRPISLEELPGIGERLMRRSTAFRKMATAFNYRMIGAIFQNWKEAVQPID